MEKRDVAGEVIDSLVVMRMGRCRRQKRGTEGLETGWDGGPGRDVMAHVVEITPAKLGHLDSCNVSTRKTFGLLGPVWVLLIFDGLFTLCHYFLI